MAGFNWSGREIRLSIRYVLQGSPQTDADCPGTELLLNVAKCFIGNYLTELLAVFTTC